MANINQYREAHEMMRAKARDLHRAARDATLQAEAWEAAAIELDKAISASEKAAGDSQARRESPR
jgi:hypothetical protein